MAERFRAVAVDLPGFGLSKPLREGFRLGPVSAHLSSLMQSLGHERYAIVGHSMGGLIASHLAASDPGVAGLVLISPSFPSEGAGRPIYARLGENRAPAGCSYASLSGAGLYAGPLGVRATERTSLMLRWWRDTSGLLRGPATRS